jgi:hypothetical protein
MGADILGLSRYLFNRLEFSSIHLSKQDIHLQTYETLIPKTATFFALGWDPIGFDRDPADQKL